MSKTFIVEMGTQWHDNMDDVKGVQIAIKIRDEVMEDILSTLGILTPDWNWNKDRPHCHGAHLTEKGHIALVITRGGVKKRDDITMTSPGQGYISFPLRYSQKRNWLTRDRFAKTSRLDDAGAMITITAYDKFLPIDGKEEHCIVFIPSAMSNSMDPLNRVEAIHSIVRRLDELRTYMDERLAELRSDLSDITNPGADEKPKLEVIK